MLGKILTGVFMVFLAYSAANAESQGSISGCVTWKGGYGAVPNATVNIYNISGKLINSISTNQQGMFNTVISGGVYRVSAEKDNLVKQYYPGKYMIEDAGLVTVIVGQNVSISFLLDSGGWISGNFGYTGDNTESGLITAIKLDQPYEGWYKSLTLAGPFPCSYAISGLIPGTYKILGRARGKCTEYYPGVKDIIAATPVAVIKDLGTSHITFNLNQVGSGAVQGRVYDQITGMGLYGLTLYAYQWQDFWQDPNLVTAVSDSNGSYVLNVSSGDYFIFCIFTDPEDASEAQYYNKKYEPINANSIRIRSGSHIQDIDFPIDLSEVHNLSIAGSVVDRYTENGLGDVVITAIDYRTGQSMGSAYSNNDGGFSVNGLGRGRYLLMFSGTYIIPHFYPLSENWQNGEVIDLTSHFGNIRTDAITQDYGNNGLVIAGNVTSADGPVDGARIYAIPVDETSPIAYARTDEYGSYSIVSGLVPGWYHVTCDLFGYQYQQFPENVYLDLMTNPLAADINFSLFGTNKVVDDAQIPANSISILGNYPNPFNSRTLIRLYSDRSDRLSSKLSVFNMLGQLVGCKVVQIIPGENVVEWDSGESGSMTPSGVYFYRFDGIDVTCRMILLK